jgi:hypothetical protein
MQETLQYTKQTIAQEASEVSSTTGWDDIVIRKKSGFLSEFKL